MLEAAIKEQVIHLFKDLKSEYRFDISADPRHPERATLNGLLEEVAACSPKTTCRVNDGEGLSFTIVKDGIPSSFLFRAVPTGHEFSTLLLAVLNLDGIGRNLPDEVITARIRALRGPVNLKSFISLSCTNCPDVVQALNIMAILNPEIRHEIIDGSLHQEEVTRRHIQAVPSVFAGEDLLHVGRSDLGELLSKLEERYGTDYRGTEGKISPFDVIVAGGGPAGVTAAIYSARKGLKVALVTEHMGGQLTETLAIDNMISVPGTTGSRLAANLQTHLSEYPVQVLENRRIDHVELAGGQKLITTSTGEILSAPALIIATGAGWRRLNVPGEKEYLGSGVAFCAHCDGPFYKGKRVAVIGGGNSGLEAAIDMAGLAVQVTVIEFLDELKGDQILQDKIATLPHVSVITGAETIAIRGDGSKVTALQFRNRNTGEEKSLELDGVFVQIGLKPNSQVFAGIVPVNRFGEITIDAHCRTGVPGAYAAGDITDVPFKQIVIAMGEGAKAALSAFDDRIKDRLGS
ncbi:MAG TPA: alkyl hydroperoxide reductase subunit F [Bacteroidales bacterium]|nr:alkyl hydroperoxide reductase subunit F [Bacteroidales bacterium]HPS63056.1 alkyl hydroperoxide reductase subunit F [Bacteroidales bacterium]